MGTPAAADHGGATWVGLRVTCSPSRRSTSWSPGAACARPSSGWPRAARWSRPPATPASGGTGAQVADQVVDDRLLDLFVDGHTLVLQGLHRVWPALVDFAGQLVTDLGHPVQVNAYVTPSQSQGFSAHYDTHDVFVLQVAGEKRWRIHEPVLPSPLRDQPWTDHRAAVEERATGDPVIDTVLRPGDSLYLPRGYLHAAEALGGVTCHLTVGDPPGDPARPCWRPWSTWSPTTCALRASLPFGSTSPSRPTSRRDLDATVRGAARRGSARSRRPTCRRPWRAARLGGRRAAPAGPARAGRGAAQPAHGDGPRRPRRHLDHVLVADDEGGDSDAVSLVLPGRRIGLGARERKARAGAAGRRPAPGRRAARPRAGRRPGPRPAAGPRGRRRDRHPVRDRRPGDAAAVLGHQPAAGRLDGRHRGAGHRLPAPRAARRLGTAGADQLAAGPAGRAGRVRPGHRAGAAGAADPAPGPAPGAGPPPVGGRRLTTGPRGDLVG